MQFLKNAFLEPSRKGISAQIAQIEIKLSGNGDLVAIIVLNDLYY